LIAPSVFSNVYLILDANLTKVKSFVSFTIQGHRQALSTKHRTKTNKASKQKKHTQNKQKNKKTTTQKCRMMSLLNGYCCLPSTTCNCETLF